MGLFGCSPALRCSGDWSNFGPTLGWVESIITGRAATISTVKVISWVLGNPLSYLRFLIHLVAEKKSCTKKAFFHLSHIGGMSVFKDQDGQEHVSAPTEHVLSA